ncbi:reverse transcriptase domain-containing protein, partial [Tanacetum coccineum]
MPNNVKTYDGTGDPKDHVKIFQAAAQVERWAMPTWCHMFNSTLIGAARVWFDELPPESIDGYKDLKAAFLAYFMQQKKYVKDPVEIHNIKQRDGETIEEFMERFKVETERMKGAPECMRISEFMHGVNNPELTKRLNEHVPKTMEEMMITTTAFIRGEATAAGKKKGHTSWRTQDQSKRHGSERRSDFRGQPRDGRGSSKFTPLQEHIKKSSRPKQESLNRHPHGNPDGEEKQQRGRDQPKVGKKEVPARDKSMAIYMIQPCHRMTRQKVTQSFERVSEITFHSLTTSSGTEGPLVIEVEIGGHMIHRVLLVTIGDADHSTRAWMNFMIVRSLSPYNGIIRRPGIREIQAVPSTAHRMLKFPVDGGIVTIRSTILIPAECAMVITSSKEIPKEAGVRHENFKVALHPNFPDQEVAIRGTLSAKERTELCSLLKKNLDIFAWKPSDMTGVPQLIAKHRLNIREGYSPIRQKKRGQASERAKAIQAEDCYPLPEIDWKVESLCGYPFKCFLDAYKGYHQIQMAESDEEKTAFHTSQGVYCYTKMPFGLKNTGATYQRLVDKAFDSQVGRNIEVYIDNLVIKSHTEAEMLRDIDEMFRTFLSKSAKRSLPLFKTLKKCIKNSGFHWTPEAEQAFKQLKQHLSTPVGSTQAKGRTDCIHEPWTLFTDGSSCVDGSGAGLILTSPEGTEFTYALRFQFTTSNNEAEYEALIAGLRIATQMGVRNVH